VRATSRRLSAINSRVVCPLVRLLCGFANSVLGLISNILFLSLAL
jgi:hypothetical protein